MVLLCLWPDLSSAAGVVEHLTDRVWMRSHEEEQGPVRVYRPQGFAFPPARGREGMRFHADGTFELVSAGRGDRPGSDRGRWQSQSGNPGRITVSIDGTTLEFSVLEVNENVLRLEWLSP
jgi:hypothetical protein